MNTLSQSPATVNASNSVAFRFGIEAAQRGEPCVPEMVFIQRTEQVKFALGYESITGATFATVQFTGSTLPAPEPVKAKTHNWHDFNADRAIARSTKHHNWLEACLERTARETPENAGNLLWLQS